MLIALCPSPLYSTLFPSSGMPLYQNMITKNVVEAGLFLRPRFQRPLLRLTLKSLISSKPPGSIFNLSTQTPIPCSLNVDCRTSQSPHFFSSSVPYSTTFSSSGMPLYQNMISKDVVVPLHPLQHQTLPLSKLDLALPPVAFHFFFCYDNPSKKTFASILSELKSSLSRAFLPYYVFAGRLVKNSVGEVELHCNNQGAELSQAYAATALSEIDFYNVDESVQGKLVPELTKISRETVGTPVFAVQVTMLSCGSIVIGCTFDHRVADAYSAVMFLKCWAKISKNEPIESLNPSLIRSIFCPRDPPTYSSEIENFYAKEPVPPLQESVQQIPRATRIYCIDARQVENLQISASENGIKRTKFEAFSAYLWKLLMHAKDVEDTMMSRLGIVVDGRSRLINMGVTPNYFGNVLLMPWAEASVGHIKSEPLSWSAKLVHGAICSAVDAEDFQSLIDLVETVRPASMWPSIYWKRDNMVSTAVSVLVSSGLRFGFSEVDYGWGKPMFQSLHFSLSGELGYVMPMMSPLEDGSWVVYMHLPAHHIDAIESKSDGELRPINIKTFLGL